LHGVPRSLVSDRDPRFTAHFYKELARLMGTVLNMSTSRHAQTDGQSEREIQTLIASLRSFCNDHQDDWDDYLDMLELGFNSSVQASTQHSPHGLLYGTEPRLPIDVALDGLVPRVPAAMDRATRMKEALDHARGQLAKAQEHQKKNADRHRRELTLAVGDQVLLSTEGLQLRNFDNKLCSRYVGPFAVTRVVNPNAIELTLPPQMQALHPVFNISRLKPYVPSRSEFATRPQRYDRPPPEADADSNGDRLYEVERLVACRKRGRTRDYLVAWKGYPPEENTWEPRASVVRTAREALVEFESTHGVDQAVAAVPADGAVASLRNICPPCRGVPLEAHVVDCLGRANSQWTTIQLPGKGRPTAELSALQQGHAPCTTPAPIRGGPRRGPLPKQRARRGVPFFTLPVPSAPAGLVALPPGGDSAPLLSGSPAAPPPSSLARTWKEVANAAVRTADACPPCAHVGEARDAPTPECPRNGRLAGGSAERAPSPPGVPAPARDVTTLSNTPEHTSIAISSLGCFVSSIPAALARPAPGSPRDAAGVGLQQSAQRAGAAPRRGGHGTTHAFEFPLAVGGAVGARA
jgi:hypothetical protein